MKGTFVLSFDIELAWGSVGSLSIERNLVAVGKVRQVLDPVLKIIGKYRMPATWSIIGHVFLDHCERKGRAHPDMPRPHYSWFDGDWYKYDPCTNINVDPSWYGKDIVEKIISYAKHSPAEQDIGCHSFSHQIFGDPGCSEELARAEIDKSLEIMAGYGLFPKTFIFPIGSVGHLDIIKEKGFTAVRGRLVERIQRYASLEKSMENMLHKNAALMDEFTSYYLPERPPVFLPEQTLPGLWDIPGSMGFGKKMGVPNHLVVSKAKRGIKRAIEEKKCFHMFTHLHSLGVDSVSLLKDFESVISFAAEEREKRRLLIVNMQEYVRTLS